MWRSFLFLIGLVCAFSTNAQTNQELLNNLSSRLSELPEGRGTLIQSFTKHSQSYVYDQALAIIALSKSREKSKARSLLRGLESLQLKDGSLYFSYYLDGKSPYPMEGDKRFAGAIAWVAMAATHYQKQFTSDEFVSFNSKILQYLDTQMTSFKLAGEKIHAVKFAPTDIKTTEWNESETVALEHNLDALSAYSQFESLNQTGIWDKNIRHLRTFVLSMWDKSRSHFWSGADTSSGRINKSELYLDNQSWSLLALDQETLNTIKPLKALELNCAIFQVNHEGISGFMDSKPVNRPASSQFVWSEGTLGQIMAMKKIKSTCNDQSPEYFLESIEKMKKKDGGVAYSTTTSNPDFTTDSSVAGTAWLYFALNDINPFQN